MARVPQGRYLTTLIHNRRSFTHPRLTFNVHCHRLFIQQRAGLEEHASRVDRGVPMSPTPPGRRDKRPPYIYLGKCGPLRRFNVSGKRLPKRGLSGIFCGRTQYFIRFDAKSTSQNTGWRLLRSVGYETGSDQHAVIARGAGGRDSLPGGSKKSCPRSSGCFEQIERMFSAAIRSCGNRAVGKLTRDRHETIKTHDHVQCMGVYDQTFKQKRAGAFARGETVLACLGAQRRLA